MDMSWGRWWMKELPEGSRIRWATRTLGSTFRTLHTTHHRSRGRPRFTHTQGRPQVHRQDLKPSLGTQEIPKCTRLERSQDTAWGDIPRGRRGGDLAPGSSLRHAILAVERGGAWRVLLKGTFRMLAQTFMPEQRPAAECLHNHPGKSLGPRNSGLPRAAAEDDHTAPAGASPV